MLITVGAISELGFALTRLWAHLHLQQTVTSGKWAREPGQHAIYVDGWGKGTNGLKLILHVFGEVFCPPGPFPPEMEDVRSYAPKRKIWLHYCFLSICSMLQ